MGENTGDLSWRSLRRPGLVALSTAVVSACTINVVNPNPSGNGGGSSDDGGLGSGFPSGSSSSGSSIGGNPAASTCNGCAGKLPQAGALCSGAAQCLYPQAHETFACSSQGSSWQMESPPAVTCPGTRPAVGSPCSATGTSCLVCAYAQGCNAPIATMLCGQGTWTESPADATNPPLASCGADAGAPPTQNVFAFQITIDGANRSFHPQTILGGFGSVGTAAQLPAVAASSGTSIPGSPNDIVVGLVTNPSTIAGPGKYVLAPFSAQGVSQGGDGVYTDPQYKNADGTGVGFECQPGGTLTITQYSTQIGGRIAGSFSCTLSGTQSLAMGSSKTMIGALSGTFNVALTTEGL